jgi:hypothetical protein
MYGCARKLVRKERRPMGGILFGVIVMAGGVGFLLARKSQLNKRLELRFVETSTAQKVRENCEKFGKDLGSGNYVATVELKGVVECDSPLTAEHSKTPCVWYHATTTREYEERVHNKGSGSATRRGSETVASRQDATRFSLSDDTGTILVDPEDAEVVSKVSFDEFKPEVGRFGGGGRKTVGYRYKEQIVPVGQTLYVFGEASDTDGVLAVRKPTTKGRFIVSVKSEEAMVREYAGSAKFLYVAGIAALVLGLMLILYGACAG